MLKNLVIQIRLPSTAPRARHALATGDQTAIANWTRWPEAARNHPTPEHFHPLIMAAGMGDGTAHQLHESWTHGALAMDVWGWPRKS